MYPFGYGLSYTSFDYQWKSISIGDNGQMNYAVNVTNTGSVASGVSVLGFVSFSEETAGCPLKQLFAFEKIFLDVGQTKSIEFFVSPPAALCVLNGKQWSPEGTYHVEIGEMTHKFAYSQSEGLFLKSAPSSM